MVWRIVKGKLHHQRVHFSGLNVRCSHIMYTVHGLFGSEWLVVCMPKMQGKITDNAVYSFLLVMSISFDEGCCVAMRV